MTQNDQAPQQGAHSITYRPDIDGLRALAVSLVVLVHAFPKLVPNGHVGVDIFFVISGYLITKILLLELGERRFSIREFYVRRANRIFPALVLVLAACLVFGWLSLYAGEFGLLGRSVAAGAGFVANLNFYLEGGYWDIAAKLKPMLHLWSLGVEEQFYLLWPALLWLAWWRRIPMGLLLAVAIAASLAWNLRTTPVNQPAAFYLPLARFWELLAGSVLAAAALPRAGSASAAPGGWRARWRALWNQPWVREGAAVLGLVLIALALRARYRTEAFPGRHAILPVLGAALLIAAGAGTWLNQRLLANRVLVYVGLISYPLYLWHWPVLTFARILGNGEPPPAARIAAVVLAVLLAAATYHWVETPLRRLPARRGTKAMALAGLLAACGVAGYAVHARDGVPSRHQASLPALPPAPAPLVPDDGRVLAFLGDSQATVFSAYMPVAPRRSVSFAKAGWPHLEGTAFSKNEPGTPALTEQALASIAGDPAIDVVIVANMYNLYAHYDRFGAVDRFYSLPPVPGETAEQAYFTGLRRTAQRLAAAGKTVLYLKSIPFMGSVPSVEACAAERMPVPRRAPADCSPPLAEVQRFRAGYDEAVARAFAGIANVAVFDPLPLLCDAERCHVTRGGIVMYRDSSHLSQAGSHLLGIELMRRVDAIRAAQRAPRSFATKT